MNINWNGMIAFFGTGDLKKTEQFYKEILGFSLEKDQGKCQIYDVPGGGKIGFCSHIPVNAHSKSPIITFVTDEVDQVYENMINRGLVIQNKPEKNLYFHIYHFFVQDPNGYTVEIQKFLE